MATIVSPFPGHTAEAVRPSGLLRWATTVDHKDIGILYLVTTLVFFGVGGIEALLIRVQLAVPGNTFLEADAYNAVFTMHGVTMIFLVVMPMLLGFANYIVPLQIGALDMAFPKLNAMSYWLLLFGGILLYYGFLNGTPPDTGWFSYAPLSERPYTLRPSVDYWALGLLVTSVGTIATGVNLFVNFGHPEVYIMALPSFGIISEVVPVFSRKPIFGYAVVVASGVAIGFLSATVWAHHMFTVGLGQIADAAFGLSSMTIAIPTGVKVFSWLATLWGGRIRLTTAMLFALAFIVQFTIGGLSGVHFASVPRDWHTHESYYLVAHFHYVLGGGSLFAILAATFYWFPKLTGRLLDERLGQVTFWLMAIGFNLTFFPMHILGLMGATRRTYTYPDLPGWRTLNFVQTIGAFVMAAAVLALLWNVLRALRHGQVAGDNPWNAWTLEWATSSPPPAHNFVRLPPITSHRPLYELQHASGSVDS